jgi:tungstate transport system substrate-binding protein
MGETLRIANERHAYTLSDRGTYLSMRSTLALEILVEGDPRLRNPYSVITVRGAKQARGARRFAAWIVSEPAQELIGSFGAARFGQQLFIPDAR